ncbi:copper chaperone CopZ [Thermosediminibacter oceani]|uniref:Copper chaperone CopZ n=1 Tax=Thermosediminibacter oceani (strain ATCC BAA-1034 / DSM 16646 / JW/IW-1228P) TaxID=555079 RepID=D9S273_THEOJ|nr:copper chaperone CopZ [Thermosediminibacter oceani]ADL07500.1 copper ion binding protein [Thermosediminibacter oceani DSM 16646]
MPHCCNHGPGRSDITLKVSGMSCSHCKHAVESAVKALPGIEKVDARVEDGKVDVSFDPSKVSLEQITRAIEDAGYEVQR